jgi:hypothetical protein
MPPGKARRAGVGRWWRWPGRSARHHRRPARPPAAPDDEIGLLTGGSLQRVAVDVADGLAGALISRCRGGRSTYTPGPAAVDGEVFTRRAGRAPIRRRGSPRVAPGRSWAAPGRPAVNWRHVLVWCMRPRHGTCGRSRPPTSDDRFAAGPRAQRVPPGLRCAGSSRQLSVARRTTR